MMTFIQQFKGDLLDMGSSVEKMESSMCEYTSSYNTMVDANAVRSKEIAWLSDKVADLEDMSRRNNIKLRGVPESVRDSHLQQFAHNLFSSMVPSLMNLDLVIDRIHRLPKPSLPPP